MTAKIRNLGALSAGPDGQSRQIVLTIADRVLHRLDAYTRIKSIMKRDGDILTIGTRTWICRPSAMCTWSARARRATTWRWPSTKSWATA